MLQTVESELQQPISIQLAFSCDICMPIAKDKIYIIYIDISEEQLFGSCCFFLDDNAMHVRRMQDKVCKTV